MKWKRKQKRKNLPNNRCPKCGSKMIYKESMNIYFCDNCGRERRNENENSKL